MTKPCIGYTSPNRCFDMLQWLIALSIRVSGGKPVRLYPNNPKFDEDIKGLVIGGGTDLQPELFDLAPKENYIYDPERDELEIKWLDYAEEKNIPVLGICRGAQLLNVHRGGNLHLDVSKVYEDAKYPTRLLARVFFRKWMTVLQDTRLYKILNVTNIKVNSLHTQAIDKLGRDLVVSAKEANGVVQCIEDPTRPFYVGVQFHPEALIYRKIFRGIFKELVTKACNK